MMWNPKPDDYEELLCEDYSKEDIEPVSQFCGYCLEDFYDGEWEGRGVCKACQADEDDDRSRSQKENFQLDTDFPRGGPGVTA